jgi:hypothetical protein
MIRIATIECSALLEVYPQNPPGGPSLDWSALDKDCCQAPPLRRCPHACVEIKIKLRFPNLDG